jgi:tripartite-type tricarboxylate transporter receptor subunit TctC
MIEAGFPGFDVTSWFALFAPAGTPPAIIQRLHLEVEKALREPRVREVLAREGIEAVGSSPDELAALVRNELARWAKIVSASGARID